MISTLLFGAYEITYRLSGGVGLEKRPFILNDVSLEIEEGEVIALLGPNGSGKSTLMKIMAGVLPLNRPGCSGKVQYQGKDFLSLPGAQRAQKVGYISPDFRSDFPLTAEEAVFLGRTCHGHGFLKWASREDREIVKWAMNLCLCWDLRSMKLDHLSGGERQLVALARALAQGAKILFLDETLSRMDLNHQAAVGKTLRSLAKEGWSILLVSHDVNLASEWADRGVLLKSGKKLLQGPIRDILTQSNIQALYPASQLIVGSNPMTGAPKVFFSNS